MQERMRMEVNKMGRSRESGSRVNSVWARQASTGELLSPRHVHKPSKHKPAYFFLLNPEVILRHPQTQFRVFPSEDINKML